MTSSFLGNLISPLCSSFGLLMKPVLHPRRSVTVDVFRSSSLDKDKGIGDDRSESKKRSRYENDNDDDTGKETEKDDDNQNNDNSKIRKQTNDDDLADVHTDNTTASSTSKTTSAAVPQGLKTQKMTQSENPWLYRSILLAEIQDDSKVDAVNVQEAVMYSHAFATEGVFGSGDINVAISDFSLTAGDLENDPEDKDDDQGESLPGERPADGDPPEDFLRLQARIELVVPLSYKKAFSHIRSVTTSGSINSTEIDAPEKIIKSLCKVHTGKYCVNLNRLHFEVKFVPTEEYDDPISSKENPLLNIMINGSGNTGSEDTMRTISDKEKNITDVNHTDKRQKYSTSEPSPSSSMSMPMLLPTSHATDAASLSAIAVWMKQHIEASGPAGISLDVLSKLHTDHSSRRADPKINGSADDANGLSAVNAPETAQAEIMLGGRELVKKKEIIMDRGDGFHDSGVHCIETFEKRAVHFVHISFSSLYSVKTSSTLFPGEGSCPWILIGGKRNELFYRMLRAKVSSILSQRPGSSLKSIHAGFPQLSLNQINILVSTMAREGLVYPRKPLTSTRLTSPFQTRSTHASTMGYYLQF